MVAKNGCTFRLNLSDLVDRFLIHYLFIYVSNSLDNSIYILEQKEEKCILL